MMPISFEQQNALFGKPANMTDEQCMSLPVWMGHDTNGFPVIISKWKLSKEDIEDINRTGEIWLSIFSTGMPAVALQTESPLK